MTHRDRAAVDVDLVVRHAHLAHEPQHHRGERLVDLDQVDVVDRHAGPGQRLAGGRRRAGQHDRRFLTGDSAGHDSRSRGESQVVTDLLGTDHDQRRAVHDPGGVAGVVHVLDALHPVVAL